MRARRFENILKLLSKRGMQWSASSMWKKKSALTSACVVNTVEVSDVRVDRNKKNLLRCTKGEMLPVNGRLMKVYVDCLQVPTKILLFQVLF